VPSVKPGPCPFPSRRVLRGGFSRHRARADKSAEKQRSGSPAMGKRGCHRPTIAIGWNADTTAEGPGAVVPSPEERHGGAGRMRSTGGHRGTGSAGIRGGGPSHRGDRRAQHGHGDAGHPGVWCEGSRARDGCGSGGRRGGMPGRAAADRRRDPPGGPERATAVLDRVGLRRETSRRRVRPTATGGGGLAEPVARRPPPRRSGGVGRGSAEARCPGLCPAGFDQRLCGFRPGALGSDRPKGRNGCAGCMGDGGPRYARPRC